MIRFGVYDDGNRCLGQRVLPMTSLMSGRDQKLNTQILIFSKGYRHIPLRNEFNQPLDFASIFVHFEVTDYVPKAYSGTLRRRTSINTYLFTCYVVRFSRRSGESHCVSIGSRKTRENTRRASGRRRRRSKSQTLFTNKSL